MRNAATLIARAAATAVLAGTATSAFRERADKAARRAFARHRTGRIGRDHVASVLGMLPKVHNAEADSMWSADAMEHATNLLADVRRTR